MFLRLKNTMNSLKSFFLFSYFLTFLACTSAQYRAVDYNTVIDHDGAYAIELDLKNETLSPTASPTTVPNPSSRPGNKHSRIIIGYIFQAVTLLTFLFAIITFRKEIYSGIRSVGLTLDTFNFYM